MEGKKIEDLLKTRPPEKPEEKKDNVEMIEPKAFRPADIEKEKVDKLSEMGYTPEDIMSMSDEQKDKTIEKNVRPPKTSPDGN